jgi:pimeloyl-ACP methyl ester carboxylesterase
MARKGLVVALVLAAGAAAQPVKSTTKAALLLTEMLSPVKPLQLLADPRVTVVDLPNGKADLYEGRNTMPGVVLVHGVAPGGPADPRIVEIARSLNRLGRTVLAPYLGLGDQRLDRTDPARIRQSIDYLEEKTGDRVMVLAFSFGAAFSLVAMEQEPAIQDKVRSLATVGTYFDLVHLLQGVTAGRVNAPGGLTDEWSPDPRAGKAVTEFLAAYLPPDDEKALVEAYEERNPEGLNPPSLAIYDLMVNTDPARTRDLVAALPAGLGDLIADLSPAARIDRIRIPVQAMHSRQDPAAPPSESALLVASLEPPATGRLTRVGSFRHVTPAKGVGLLKDAGPLLGFVSRVFGVQERWGIYP